jgi:hypothetical protein
MIDLMEAKILNVATTVLLEIFFCFGYQDKLPTKWVLKQYWAQLNLLLKFQLMYARLIDIYGMSNLKLFFLHMDVF